MSITAAYYRNGRVCYGLAGSLQSVRGYRLSVRPCEVSACVVVGGWRMLDTFLRWTVSDWSVTHPIYHGDVASLQCLSHHAAVTE